MVGREYKKNKRPTNTSVSVKALFRSGDGHILHSRIHLSHDFTISFWTALTFTNLKFKLWASNYIEKYARNICAHKHTHVYTNTLHVCDRCEQVLSATSLPPRVNALIAHVRRCFLLAAINGGGELKGLKKKREEKTRIERD